jgi:glycosyltransferase involved in cell wall biosynthesis
MKLIIFIDDLNSGGTENVLLSRLKHLSSDIEVRLVTLFAKGELSKDFEAINIDVSCLEIKQNGYLKTFIKARKIIKEFQPEIALCLRDGCLALLPAFLRFYIPCVLTSWENNRIHLKGKLAFFIKIQLKFISDICAVSNNIATQLKQELGFKNVSIIHHCLETDRFKPHNSYDMSPPLKLISVGNLREEKNHFEQLKIALKLKETGIDFKLKIAGEGHLRKQLEEQIQEYNLEEQVDLAGQQSNIPELLSESDIFLFTSKSEGFGVVIIEAMASAIPCIIYNLPIISEIDPENKSINIIPQENTSKAVETIMFLKANPEIAKTRALEGRKIVLEKFSVKNNTADWENYLRAQIKK